MRTESSGSIRVEQEIKPVIPPEKTDQSENEKSAERKTGQPSETSAAQEVSEPERPSRIQRIQHTLLRTQQHIVVRVQAVGVAIGQAGSSIKSGVIGFWQTVQQWVRQTFEKTSKQVEVMRAWAKTSWQPGQAAAAVKQNIVEELVAVSEALPVAESSVEDVASTRQDLQEEWRSARDQIDLAVYAITVNTELFISGLREVAQ
ncbi:hypothetical protein HZA86_01085 [Candidatus Uhrbacteria bacterium]|nr:hypothetical protein [Candidatus Uhrbacteria bacterium]